MTLPGLILDLDGTVCLGDQPIPSAAEAIAELRRRGHPIAFVSNTLETRADCAARLAGWGIPADPQDLILLPWVLAEYLRREHPRASIFGIGEPTLLDPLAPEFSFTDDPARIEVVLVSVDYQLDFRKLNVAYQALQRGARFLATNLDPVWPHPAGLLPDTGAVVAALEACSRRKVDAVVGKPSTVMARMALRRLGLRARDTWVVGDGLASDMEMARKARMTGVLVLTGATRADDLRQARVRPQHVLPSLAELPSLLRRTAG